MARSFLATFVGGPRCGGVLELANCEEEVVFAVQRVGSTFSDEELSASVLVDRYRLEREGDGRTLVYRYDNLASRVP